MEFFDVLKARHSIRAYTLQAVEPEKLQQIFDAIVGAPTAGNRQAFEVYLVCDESKRVALAAAAGDQPQLAQAPAVLVFCTHPALSAGRFGARGAELYCLQDATIACTFAMLSATALGLSTVWVGAVDEDQVRGIIGAPDDQRPVAILPIGYPAETPQLRPRRPQSDMVHQVG